MNFKKKIYAMCSIKVGRHFFVGVSQIQLQETVLCGCSYTGVAVGVTYIFL